MKILYYFAETSNYMEAWQRAHIFDDLTKHGILIDVFNPLKFYSIEEANQQLVQKVKRGGYDLFMTCHASEWFVDGTIESIRKEGLRTLLVCFDNMHAPFMHRRIASKFDLVWLTSRENMNLFKTWGCHRVVSMPYAANPSLFTPRWTDRAIPKVSFIGSPYGSRVSLLNSLVNNGVPVDLFSGGIACESREVFPLHRPRKSKLCSILECLSFRIGRQLVFSKVRSMLEGDSRLCESPYLTKSNSVPFNEMLGIYSNYALSLNSLVLRNTGVLKRPLFKLHLRTFEIPMAGGLEFAQRNEELCEYFDEDKEIVLWGEEEEMLDKARFYLDEKNTGRVSDMKRRARWRAESEHTWFLRFKNIFNLLDIK